MKSFVPGPWFSWLLYPYRALLSVVALLGTMEVVRLQYMTALLQRGLFWGTEWSSYWYLEREDSPGLVAFFALALPFPYAPRWLLIDLREDRSVRFLKSVFFQACVLVVAMSLADLPYRAPIAAPFSTPVGWLFVVRRVVLAAVAVPLVVWLGWEVRRAAGRLPKTLLGAVTGYTAAFLTFSILEYQFGALRYATPLWILASIGLLTLLICCINAVYALAQALNQLRKTVHS